MGDTQGMVHSEAYCSLFLSIALLSKTWSLSQAFCLFLYPPGPLGLGGSAFQTLWGGSPVPISLLGNTWAARVSSRPTPGWLCAWAHPWWGSLWRLHFCCTPLLRLALAAPPGWNFMLVVLAGLVGIALRGSLGLFYKSIAPSWGLCPYDTITPNYVQGPT